VWIQLACALDRLGHGGNGSAFGRVARTKGIGYGTVSLYTKRVIAALKDLAPRYIFWPDEAERVQLSHHNHENFGFDGCICPMMVLTLYCSKPGLEGNVYFNRKSSYSMNVLLTFDAHRNIRYLISGWPGSVHDSTIWESGAVVKNPDKFFSPGQYQLGDCGFRLTRTMLIPYRQPAASLTDNEEFNLRFLEPESYLDTEMACLKDAGNRYDVCQ